MRLPSNRTGLVVLLDMFILLFFVTALTTIRGEPQIRVMWENVFDTETSIMVARRIARSDDWEVFVQGRWVPFDRAAPWALDVVATYCNEICEDQRYGLRDLSNARLFVGGLAGRKIANFFFNDCRREKAACRKLTLRVENNAVSIEQPS